MVSIISTVQTTKSMNLLGLQSRRSKDKGNKSFCVHTVIVVVRKRSREQSFLQQHLPHHDWHDDKSSKYQPRVQGKLQSDKQEEITYIHGMPDVSIDASCYEQLRRQNLIVFQITPVVP